MKKFFNYIRALERQNPYGEGNYPDSGNYFEENFKQTGIIV